MAKICSRCASESEDDARFCGSCGTPLTAEPIQQGTQDEVGDRTVIRSAAPVAPPEPIAPAAPPAYLPPPPTPAAPPAYLPPPPTPAAPPAYVPPPPAPGPQAVSPPPAVPAPPMVNPFSGVPISDYLRDAGALTFLLAAFFKPWYASGNDDSISSPYHHPWWVIIAILVSMLSVAVPYVVKSRAVVGLTRDAGAVLKLAMSAPLLVAAVAEVIMDVTHGRSISHQIGGGVAVAVLGAVLALLPRHADEEPGRDDARWWAIVKVVAVIAVLAGVATSLAFLVIGLASSDTSGYKFNSFKDEGLVPLVEGLTRVGALTAIPAIALLGRRIAGARVLGAVAVATAAMVVLTTVNGRFWSGPVLHGSDSWRESGGLVLLVTAAGALALSRAVSRVTTSGSDLADWMATAKLALVVAIAAGVSMAVLNITQMVVTHEHPGQTIAATVLYALTGVGAGVAVALLNTARPNRLVALAVTIGLAVLAIIAAAVAHSGSIKEPLLATAFVGLWVMPLFAGCAIAIPKSMSAAYGPLVSPRAPATPSAPVQYRVGDVVNGHRFDGTQWMPLDGPPAAN